MALIKHVLGTESVFPVFAHWNFEAGTATAIDLEYVTLPLYVANIQKQKKLLDCELQT